MVSLYSEIRFLSAQEHILIPPNDYSCSKYLNKKDESIHRKVAYFEKRGYKVLLNNKRPYRLKDKLQELEEALQTSTIVCYNQNEKFLQLLLSKGIIANLKLALNGDLIEVTFDKTLLPKVSPDVIVDGILYKTSVIASCKDGKIVGYSDIVKEWTIDSGYRRNVDAYSEWLVCWGKAGNDHPQPWSPLAKDHQRANVHLYWIGSRGPDLLSYKKTEGEPIKIVVSKKTPRSLILIEQKVSHKGAVSVEVSLLELVSNALKRLMVTLVPLQTQVCCLVLSTNESFLLIGCIDGSLALLDRYRGSTRMVKNSFIPTFLAFHAGEALSVVMNECGYIQYYDIALNPITVQTCNDEPPQGIMDISKYFNQQQAVESVFWAPMGDIILCMDSGPLLVVKHFNSALNFSSIIQLYLNSNDLEKAIMLLLAWEFNEAAFCALQRIVAQILQKPLNETTAKLLQDALGSFHSPPVPLSVETRHTYGLQVKSLTRRFFHQLVRVKMFETAFLLAVDLGHHDLFMDLYHIAVVIGETEMAAAARAQASSRLSQCSSEASNCSRSSCSQCLGSSSEEESLRDENQASNNDHLLTTNFNNPVPKTYRPSVPYVPPIPNLPKIKLPTKPSIPTPPLPIGSFNSIGIPITHHPIPFRPNVTPVAPPKVPPLLPRFNPNLANSTLITSHDSRFIPIGSIIAPPRIITPPLPITSTTNSNSNMPPLLQVNNTNGACNNNQNCSTQIKKPQPKVKFSDTVTAFIVPEVKRPVRVPPPAHVMDPQKELADSLPLCHPNEEYLKDFTPIRRDTTDSPPPQPKITVVHFGVV